MLTFVLCLVSCADRHPSDRTLTCTYDESSHNKILIDYYIMSKCPDAQICVEQYGDDIKALQGYINVQFSHIVQSMSADGTVFTCMHGAGECIGNQQQSCIQLQSNARKSNGDTTLQLYDYMMCQLSDYQNIPSNGESCCKSTNFDSNDFNECMSSSTGIHAFKHSVQRTQKAGAKKSCTITLDHKPFAIHDSKWDTSDGVAPNLIDAVCSALQHKNAPRPTICN